MSRSNHLSIQLQGAEKPKSSPI
ncbi:hypothetical protein MICRO116_230028 [Micrococcus sp. 116]|nr:hypothetical protein MICRO116_230028 [Micrococcus sp. 116]